MRAKIQFEELKARKSFGKLKRNFNLACQQEAIEYLQIARTFHQRSQDMDVAARSYTVAWTLNKALFNAEDLINFAKCASDTGVGSDLRESISFEFFSVVERQNDEYSIHALKVRFFLAIDKPQLAKPHLREVLKNGDRIDVKTALAICHLLYDLGDLKGLSRFITEHHESISAYKPVEEYISLLSIADQVDLKILAIEPGYKCAYMAHPENRTLVITFGHMRTGKRSLPYAGKFLIKNGFDVLYFSQALSTFYQMLSLEKFKALVEKVTKLKRYEKVACYGSSLGGYAAAYYSSAIDATAIASSPLLPIEPVLEDTEIFATCGVLHPTFSSLPRKKSKTFIFNAVDVKQDQKMLKLITGAALGETVVLDFPKTKHPVTAYLSNSGLLKGMVLEILRHDTCTLPKDLPPPIAGGHRAPSPHVQA